MELIFFVLLQVLYRRKDGSPLWSSSTDGQQGSEAIMQGT